MNTNNAKTNRPVNNNPTEQKEYQPKKKWDKDGTWDLDDERHTRE